MRRILALALVLGGVDRATIAKSCGMDRQTRRDWVHRYIVMRFGHGPEIPFFARRPVEVEERDHGKPAMAA